jgi:signal transduction histidine kinase
MKSEGWWRPNTVVRWTKAAVSRHHDAGPRDLSSSEATTAAATLPADTASMRDRWVAALAHDLRNPLAVIELAARVLAEHAPDQRTVDRSARAILRSVEHVKRLTDDLRRAASGRPAPFEIRPAWVPTAGLLADANATTEPLVARSSLTLAVDEPRDLPLVWADAERIGQVFENLIANATKFTPPGGRITVTAVAGTEDVRFAVADTGPGVREADRARAFAPRWQADPEDPRGQGLGLSICRQIVEAHGGRIWIESGGDRGAVFVFTLKTRIDAPPPVT